MAGVTVQDRFAAAKEKMLAAQAALLKYVDDGGGDRERHKQLVHNLQSAIAEFMDPVEELAALNRVDR